MLKAALRSILPRWADLYVGRRRQARFAHMTPQQVFTKVYTEGMWGKSGDPNRPFFSGTGSADAIARKYVDSVTNILTQMPERPDVVDLGCGDFAIGSQLRPYCGRYTACDVVASLIEHNRNFFQSLDVDFQVLDITADELPDGDIVCIRQVLQHLSNAHISEVVKKLAKYRFVILTEHLPAGAFIPNQDKPAGPDIRPRYGSGVVLTEAPFNLKVKSERVVCEAPESGGLIRTTLYEL